MHANQKLTSRESWPGILLIIIGALFFLDTLEYIDFGNLFSKGWPLILIYIGFRKLKDDEKSGGIVFLITGFAFLMTTLDIIKWHSLFQFWPLILIAIGISILLKGRHRSYHRQGQNNDFLNINTLFGGTDRTIVSDEFKGGNITVLFGGADVDLRRVKTSPEGCVLNITAIFGGVDIRVSTGLNVSVTGMPIFGAIENKISGDQKDDNESKMTCKCSVIFGAIEIKD